jgi:hypothetical protein
MDPMHFKMQIGIQRIICFSMIPLLIGLKYPAGVFIYWISNNLFTGMQVCVHACVCVHVPVSMCGRACRVCQCMRARAFIC